MKFAFFVVLSILAPSAFATPTPDYHILKPRKGGGASGGHGSSSHGSSGHGSSGRGGSVGHPSSHGAGTRYGGGGGAVFAPAALSIVTITALGLLAADTVPISTVWPGDWADPQAYVYPFNSTYQWNFYNKTLNHNETVPVACACSYHQSCTCQATNDPVFVADLVKNGTYAELNNTQIIRTNLTLGGKTYDSFVLNGTVANGTYSISAANTAVTASSYMALLVAAGVVSALMI